VVKERGNLMNLQEINKLKVTEVSNIKKNDTKKTVDNKLRKI
jgi:hypothetical protein